MRRSLVKFSNPIGNHAGSLSNHFSTSAGGSGRGRGGGLSFPFAATAPGKPNSKQDDEEQNDSPPFLSGAGHGRGVIGIDSNSIRSIPSDPGTTVVSSGRGRGATIPSQSSPKDSGPKKPIFFQRKEEEESGAAASKSPIIGDRARNPEETNLPISILSVLTGAGRGKPIPSGDGGESQIKQENRHLRTLPRPTFVKGKATIVTPALRLSPEDALKNAMGILSRGGADGIGGDRERVEERGGRGGRRGRGWRGRGRGRWGRGGEGRRQQDMDDDYGSGLYLGDDADGEKLAKRIGADNMNKLVEGFEEMSGSVLPSPMDDAYIDALHTNYMFDCEPEYLMADFESNPDIDEKPPIPLRDALEKMKPFLMAYENIQSHEEWEEVMKETMETVSLTKEIVDYYSGPDRVTAKTQQEELERVAKTLPESAPTSVKRFTERAVLSLQSNPGWGFEKKCQFMDKMVWEVSQQYK